MMKLLFFWVCVLLAGAPGGAFVSVKSSPQACRPLQSSSFEAEECPPSAAAVLVGADLAQEKIDEARWVKASRGGEPEAVGRLCGGTIDCLRTSFPKEEWKRARGALGACVDALVECYLEDCDKGKTHFEDLCAATTAETAPVFEVRGFIELENPDLTALARDEPIVTHKARLPAAVVAYGHGVVTSDSATRIADKLRRQQPPPPDDDKDETRPEEPPYDPWAGVGTTFF